MNQIVSPTSPTTTPAAQVQLSPTSTGDTSETRNGETGAPTQQVNSDGGRSETVISSPPSQSADTAEVAIAAAAAAADNDSTIPSVDTDHNTV